MALHIIAPPPFLIEIDGLTNRKVVKRRAVVIIAIQIERNKFWVPQVASTTLYYSSFYIQQQYYGRSMYYARQVTKLSHMTH